MIDELKSWIWIVFVGVVCPCIAFYATGKAFVTAARTNRLPWKLGEISRLDRPVAFWTLVSLYVLVDAMAVLAVVGMSAIALRRL